MAYQSHRSNPTAGPVKTPAPTRAPKDFGTIGGAYGGNQFGGASSTRRPGETVTSPLADDLRASSDDGQDVLGKVIARGVARGDSGFQQRSESDKQYPATFGHRPANAGGAPMGIVPSKNGGK
jgi:hypothetical protein